MSERHVTADVPGRVFLDTCVVNFMLDYSEQIHDGRALPQVGPREAADIEALRDLWAVGQRASWQVAISPYTYSEIIRTTDVDRLRKLDLWSQEVWQYWRSTVEANNDLPTFVEAEDARVRLLGSGVLTCLPDVADRVLLCDAVVYRCDLFCTRDWSTILKHRAQLHGLPIGLSRRPSGGRRCARMQLGGPSDGAVQQGDEADER
jgi:hypothetical protein